MRVAHFNSSRLKAASPSSMATAGSGVSNAPTRTALAENAENLHRPQLPDWAKAIIQHPQPARIQHIRKGPLRTPADLGLTLLVTVAAIGVIITSLALGNAPGVDPHLTIAIFAAP
jgi:hypothetical protein